MRIAEIMTSQPPARSELPESAGRSGG